MCMSQPFLIILLVWSWSWPLTSWPQNQISSSLDQNGKFGEIPLSGLWNTVLTRRTDGRHLVKSIWRYNSVGNHPICIKFGRPVQNHMPMAARRSELKPQVEFQDGGRLFSETGSSNISAADWDIWLKFGMPVALDLPKFQAWPNQKPEVDLRRYGRHLVKLIWRHNFVGDHPIFIKFGTPVQNHMPIAVERSKSKPDVEFQDGGRLFSETGSSNISAADWDIWSKFVTMIALGLLICGR